ncbi:MAG TPA: hypothetical protein PK313_03460 [Myxococcota bacterium]|jgi:hypothetical protein|nr:hypothetical protein [Myxococcota bacterium]
MADRDEIDPGRAPERWQRIVSYGVGADGQVQAVQDDGFVASNMVHSEAWKDIHHKVAAARAGVEAGTLSPIAYWMELNLLDSRLLARYVGLWHWRVRRHLRAGPFARLPDRILRRYAWVFRLPSIDALRTLPAVDPMPTRPEAAPAPEAPAGTSED